MYQLELKNLNSFEHWIDRREERRDKKVDQLDQDDQDKKTEKKMWMIFLWDNVKTYLSQLNSR